VRIISIARPVPTSRASRCVLAGDPDVARHRQLATAAEREPVDGRDRRLREGLDGVEGPLHLGVQSRVQVVVPQLGDVRARDERLLPGAGDGDEPHVVALAQLGQRVAQVGQHLPGERVAHLRPGDRDNGEAVVDLDGERLVGHHAPPKAAMPVIARPMISVCTSSVPS
jgi:hypothetical protein